MDNRVPRPAQRLQAEDGKLQVPRGGPLEDQPAESLLQARAQLEPFRSEHGIVYVSSDAPPAGLPWEETHHELTRRPPREQGPDGTARREGEGSLRQL